MARQILTNANVVLPDRSIHGSVVIEDDRIADITTNRYGSGLDLQGQLLIPGVIDIHTDYMEKELNPRPSANFPLGMAFHFMDVRAVACGLTTVLGAARISNEDDPTSARVSIWRGDGLALAKAYRELGRTALARHLVHLRWNPNFEPVEHILEELRTLESVGNLVFNDAVPGERQFRNNNEERIEVFAKQKGLALDQARIEWEARREALRKVNSRPKVKAALAGQLPIGSHDDTTVEHVDEAWECGATLAEMPCTIEAARRAKELGMLVCMGAPNYFRGGSHCGNLSCRDAMAEGLVDILCSDFHFPSMLGSVVMMMQGGMTPADAVRLVTLNPARHLRRDRDLGSIEVGKKADLVSFAQRDGFAAVTHVWVDGEVKLQSGPHSRSEEGVLADSCLA